MAGSLRVYGIKTELLYKRIEGAHGWHNNGTIKHRDLNKTYIRGVSEQKC